MSTPGGEINGETLIFKNIDFEIRLSKQKQFRLFAKNNLIAELTDKDVESIKNVDEFTFVKDNKNYKLQLGGQCETGTFGNLIVRN